MIADGGFGFQAKVKKKFLKTREGEHVGILLEKNASTFTDSHFSLAFLFVII